MDRADGALPLSACTPSTERRLVRFLANAAVTVETRWRPLLPILLASLGRRALVPVFDPTPDRDQATLQVLGGVVRGRGLPLTWRVMPQQTGWGERRGGILPRSQRPSSRARAGGTGS